ncbi:Alpha/Beta hydrolase protein [Cokeromyces recurvatus]|uniref:Alpha/Beta hydrolase protein n=1 Tax=Cokeromyces recurvatus TaxID=90255 RepID=UPI00221E8C18|nr:Alpha/Beta hydrolase protein [Cokeromyces recurvatus]KAI7899112.1 Alpha/Beta hydrolase protein [Cokeromyces recurvatus]
MRSILIGLFAASSIYAISAQTIDDYKITSLPGIDVDALNFTQYAGHIELSAKSNANIFFWMIEREIKTEPEKLIIWLNGGPGCSSMDGLFLENGPFRVKKDLSLTLNEGGWQNYATNIYVDQPVGTGFSFANTDNYMHNMSQATDQFTLFLDKLFILFPNLRQQDLYIAGESYAGTYIPYFASRLLELNKKKTTEEEKYNLQGIAIGNGWISSIHQYNAYYDYSVKYNLIDHDRIPLVSAHLKTCQDEIKQNELIHIPSCEKVLTDVMDNSIHEDKDGIRKCLNTYDIRLTEETYPNCGLTWPYELEEVTKYLRQSEVKKAIHAEKQILGWKECTALVSSEFNGDQSKPSYYEIQVLLFSGEYDLICNYIGTEYLIGNMTWNGSRGFSNTTVKESWKIDNRIAGYYTQERNLTYVFIKDGSHMVPYDRPIETLDMINRFMNVGDGKVKGKKSQVGEQEAVVKIPSPPPLKDEKHDNNTSTNQNQKEESESSPPVWNTTVFIGAFLFGLSLCCFCWIRNNNNKRSSGSAAVEFGGAPRRQHEGVKRPTKNTIWSFIRHVFSKHAEERKNFRLDDNDESNEL